LLNQDHHSIVGDISVNGDAICLALAEPDPRDLINHLLMDACKITTIVVKFTQLKSQKRSKVLQQINESNEKNYK